MRRWIFPLMALVVAGLTQASCGFTTIDEHPCPPGGTEDTFENFGRHFLASYCNSCHSADIGERKGAPDNYVFETLEQVQHHKDRIFVRSAGDNDSMPPGPDDPPIEQRNRLADWLACGAN